MKSKIKLRPAKRKDRIGMKQVNEKSLLENYDLSLWEDLVAHKNSFVVTYSEEIIGYITCDDKGLIYSFAVMLNHRRQGWGRKLLTTCIDHMRKKKINMSLNVRVGNIPAIKLYEELGFKKISISKEYYGDKEDAHFMQLLF
jgi:ribosomal protein S18 acetylase RimI-like enzyme